MVLPSIQLRIRAARNLAAILFTLGKPPAYVRQLIVGEVGTGKPNRSLACTSAMSNQARIFVWKKGRQMRKRVAWRLQHAWAKRICETTKIRLELWEIFQRTY